MDRPGLGVCKSKRLRSFKVLSREFFYGPCFLLVELIEL